MKISFIFLSCSRVEKQSFISEKDGLEVIKIDLSEAKEGKLSEFFEPEVEYIWLKDDSEAAQLNAGIQKIIFHGDKIFTLDIFGCKCIHVFDRLGNYLSKIRAYGEGPEKYLDFDNAIIVNEEILLLGVYPPKLMWFSLDGKFLREEKLKKHVGSGIYSEKENRYYFYSNTRDSEEFFVRSVNENFQDSTAFLPFQERGYYGSFSGRNNFLNFRGEVFFGMAFQDTIWKGKDGKLIPTLAFDFGKYAQSMDEMKLIEEQHDALQRLDFINKRAKLYFVPHQWFLTESLFYSGFKYEEAFFNVFFDRKTQENHVIKGRIENDLDGGFDSYSLLYRFNDNMVGEKYPGKDLFKLIQKKKESLSQKAFEDYIKGKGNELGKVAIAAKDSENPVLIVYTVKE
ncbi:6-bladed beta-propeller [Algoriphagus taiwanensis]|uniref:6-bladed beta-propeller n=1 Tax=Algoriphagus taiwanensis TaxID=1445656 RepID=UPI0030C77A87